MDFLDMFFYIFYNKNELSSLMEQKMLYLLGSADKKE
jgi:hypothetical protein